MQKLSTKPPSDQGITFDFLENIAAGSYNTFHQAIKLARKNFPTEEGFIWDFNSETMRLEKISVPDCEWEQYQEPNDEL
mgnify:FL=1